LLSAEGQTGGTWELPECQRSFGNGKELWVEQCVNVIVCCSNVALPNCRASNTDSGSLYVDHRQKVPPVVKERRKQAKENKKLIKRMIKRNETENRCYDVRTDGI
jgi:ribose 1,5-bisphosphokinase PhnN